MKPSAIKLEVPVFSDVLDALELLALPPARKRRLVARIARLVIAQAKKNVREQKTVDGTPFKPRQDGTGLPMLTRITRSRWLGVKAVSDDESLIRFFRSYVGSRGKHEHMGALANKHQKGGRALGLTITRPNYKQALDSSKIPVRLNKKQYKLDDGRPGCTANMAAMLIRLQYLPPQVYRTLPDRGGVNAVRHVMQHVSRSAARFLIGEGMKRCGATTLPDKTPARPFLGAGNEARRRWATALLNDIYGSFRAKNYIGLLN